MPTYSDWARERRGFMEFSPGKSLLAAIRLYQRCRHPLLRPVRWLAVIRWRFWSAVSGAEIPLSTTLGGGLLIPHPNGIVMHPDVIVGANCLIYQQVTLGSREGSTGVPILGDHVDVGAGAKCLGPIKIGRGSRVGANAVVVNDVPPGSTAIGIPARVKGNKRVRVYHAS